MTDTTNTPPAEEDTYDASKIKPRKMTEAERALFDKLEKQHTSISSDRENQSAATPVGQPRRN